MKLRPLLKSKKGISLESAVLFMMITFTFCFLLSSLALYGHYQVKIDTLQAQHYAEKEQIGEHFVAYLQTANDADAPEDFAAYLAENSLQYENYACEETKSQDSDIMQFALTVKRGGDESANTVLYIKAEKTAEGQVTVLAWLPSPPETAEK